MPDRLYFRLPPAPSINTLYTVRQMDGEIVYSGWARKWLEAARHIAYLQAYEQGWREPIASWTRVVFIPYFPDLRTRDVTNLHKIVCDALTRIVYTDDYYGLAHDNPPGFDPEHPRLELLVYPDDEDLNTAACVAEAADQLRDFRETFACRDLFKTPKAWQINAGRSRKRKGKGNWRRRPC